MRSGFLRSLSSCYSGHRTQGYIAQWLERLTADQQVPGTIPGGKSWFTFVTGSDNLTNQIIQMFKNMSPIRTVITTFTRKSVKKKRKSMERN